MGSALVTPKNNTASKPSKGKQLFAPHSSDSIEFRSIVVGATTLEVQLAFHLTDGFDHVLAVLPKWTQWLNHLAEKDTPQSHSQTDAMIRLLFSRLSKRPGDPLLLSCLERALDCLLNRRNSFLDIANVFAAHFYEKQTRIVPSPFSILSYILLATEETQKQLLAFHSMVATKIPQLPATQTIDTDYITWAIAYASTLVKASSFNACSALLKEVLSHVQSCPSDGILSCFHAHFGIF
jgi:hypothetical protein